LVRKSDSWLLDLRKGQTEQQMQQQAEVLGASCDAITALLNGLIRKIDTLDTDKFSYDEAWRVVDIQVNRKLDAIMKTKREEGGGGKGE
jgi:hypothetical protein